MRRPGCFRQTAKRWLDGSLHAGRTLAARHAAVLSAYERLLWPVRTRLLHPSDHAGDNRNLVNSGLLARHRPPKGPATERSAPKPPRHLPTLLRPGVNGRPVRRWKGCMEARRRTA
jgi:hypothetical protein